MALGVGHADQRAEPEAPSVRLDLTVAGLQVVDVDEDGGTEHLRRHQVDDGGAAGQELGVRLAGGAQRRRCRPPRGHRRTRAWGQRPGQGGAARAADGGDDVRIGGAAAEIAAHVFADLVVVARVALVHAGHGRQDLAGRAIAALEGVLVDEGLLHRVQGPVRRGQAFDGDHGLAHRDREASGTTARAGRPTSTVQAPHWPWSQPFLTPVKPSASRRVSSRVARGSRSSVWVWPLTVRLVRTRGLRGGGWAGARAEPAAAKANRAGGRRMRDRRQALRAWQAPCGRPSSNTAAPNWFWRRQRVK